MGSDQSEARGYREWIGALLNILFFPILLGLEFTHYAIFREWYSMSPRELMQEIGK